MSMPEYEELGEALLAFIFLKGGALHEVRASETYGPLGEFFKLTTEEQAMPRKDGNPGGTMWQNRIQWTRQKLINEGLAEARGRGVWGLTVGGIERVSPVIDKYRAFKQN